MVIIFTTFANKDKAKEIGKELLLQKLIACYNLMPVESGYWWKGKIEEVEETLMLVKTETKHFNDIEDYLRRYSGYEVTEVASVEVSRVTQPYLDWLKEVVG